jgi:hypothetical protein
MRKLILTVLTLNTIALAAGHFGDPLVSRVHAQFSSCGDNMSLLGIGGGFSSTCPHGGGGSPSFTAVNAAAKSGCGGGFTCSDTTIIGAGFAVVGFQAAGTTTAATLFEVVNTGATNDPGMWAGTVPGCSSANDISVTTNGGFGNMAYAVGLITGLSGSYSSGTPAHVRRQLSRHSGRALSVHQLVDRQRKRHSRGHRCRWQRFW